MNNLVRTCTLRVAALLVASGALLVGCGDGTPLNPQIQLPTDGAISFYCTNEGIADNNCALDNPANPYRSFTVNDTSKWDLHDSAPSFKSKFYIWATAMATGASGENQFYLADSLHRLHSKLRTNPSISSNELASIKDQSFVAYRSVLDRYYDDVSYIEVPKALDLAPDQDFNYDVWGSNTTLDGNVESDADFKPVFSVQSGGDRAIIAYTGIAKGFAADAESLKFKAKGLTEVWVKFTAGASGPETERDYLATKWATAIEGTDNWYEFDIPLSDFSDSDLYVGFAIMSPSGYNSRFLLTDVHFSGDRNKDGKLTGDVDADGAVYLYKTAAGTVLKPVEVRHWVGGKLSNPHLEGLSSFFTDATVAAETLASWGYVFDAAQQTLSKK